MKKLYIAIIFSVFLFSLSCGPSFAQDRKTISARLINKDTKQPFDPTTVIQIFYFDTEALGRDAVATINKNEAEAITTAHPVNPPDADGYFSCTLPPTGALVIKVAGTDAHIEYIRHRSEIQIGIAGGNRITQSEIIAEYTDKINVIEDESEIIADTLIAKYTLEVPYQAIFGNNARLILQPYLIEIESGDTLARLDPYICEGNEYRLTQERHMNYEIGNDPLARFVRDEPLDPTGHVVAWKDSIWLPNPQKQYMVKGILTVEDYNVIKFIQDSLALSSTRPRRPMKFLDFDWEAFHLDAQEYYEAPKPELTLTPGTMDLKFLVNRASVDMNDKEGVARMKELKSTLISIVNDESSWLREFHIESVSSPDGSYEKNLELSKRRLAYVSNYLLSDIAKSKMDRVYQTANPIVATWSDVADSLDYNNLADKAEEVRSIIRKHENNMDRQWYTIRKLPYYKTDITPILEKMRTVRYTYKHEVFRPLTPEEMLHKYRYDEEYKSGKKHFRASEYWELFRLLEEGGASKDELFDLYRRACKETEQDRGKSWIYAANKYAVACMEKGIVDTTILAPHIDMDIPYSDFRKQNINNSRRRDLYNPSAVVANQMWMYLMSYNYPKASILAQMLPDTEEFMMLKAITLCRGGHYKGGKDAKERAQRARWFEIASESSPINKAVMYLAMNTANYDLKAEEVIKNLPEDDPRTWYFKAIISSRKLKDITQYAWDEPDKFREAMLKCFELDPEYAKIAYNDNDIDEQHMEALLKEFPQYKF